MEGGRNKNKYYQSNYRGGGGGGRGGGGGIGNGGSKGKYGRDDEIVNNNSNNNNKNDKDINTSSSTDANSNDKLLIPAPKTKGGRSSGGGGNNSINNNNHPGHPSHNNNNIGNTSTATHTNHKENNNKHSGYGNNKKGSSKSGSRSATPPPPPMDSLLRRNGVATAAATTTAGGGQHSMTKSSTGSSTPGASKSNKYDKKESSSSVNNNSSEGIRTSSSSKPTHAGHNHKDPNAAAVQDASQNAFAFPSNPPTIDDISSPAHVGSPTVGRQSGNNVIPNVVTHASRILDPGNVFPRTPFIAVGDLTSGSILRNHINMTNAATSGSYDKATTASPKFSHYSGLTLMEQDPQQSSLIPSYQTQVYRSSNRFSGSLVCIRRVVSCPGITPERCAAAGEYLRQFRHPNLAQLNSVVATTEFTLGSHDVLLEYRFVKGGRSLQDIAANREELTEASIWSIACQLLSLVRHFHESEVPLRGLHVSKLLLVQDVGDGFPSSNGGSQRVIFTGLGLVDVLGTTDVPPMASSIPQLLRSDIVAVGNILYHLITSSLNVDKNAAIHSSPMFTPALFALVRACRDGNSVVNLCRALGERMSMELGTALSHSDYLLNEYSKEIHNGRLMKLLMRLNFAYCSNQPYQDYDTLIIVRLFYQYLFAQVDELGNAQFDWGLVYHGLNKLDIGSDDLVQLVSEQDHTLFVVSYKDVTRCIDALCDGMLSGGRTNNNTNTNNNGAAGQPLGAGAAANGLGLGLGLGGAGGMMDHTGGNTNNGLNGAGHHHHHHHLGGGNINNNGMHGNMNHHSANGLGGAAGGGGAVGGSGLPPPPPPPRSSGMTATNSNTGLGGSNNNNNGVGGGMSSGSSLSSNLYGGGGGGNGGQPYGGAGMNQYGNNNAMNNNNNNNNGNGMMSNQTSSSMYGGGAGGYGNTPITNQPGGGGMRPF